MRELGHTDAAEWAFHSAMRLTGETEHANNSALELMECASLRGDRLGFARWREYCRTREVPADAERAR